MFHLLQLRRAGALLIGGLALLTGLYAWQKPFKEYPGLEYTQYPIPPDPNEPTEWVFARLMYPPVPPRNGGVEFRIAGRIGRIQLDHGLSPLRPPSLARPCAV